MTIKGFRVKQKDDFLHLADQVTGLKFVDSTTGLCFFYAKKRVEFKTEDPNEIKEIIRHGFIEGNEVEVMDFW